MKKLFRSFAILIAVFASTFHTGCDSTEITDSTVSVMFSLSSITQKISDDAIRLDTVKVLFRDVKIKNQSSNDKVNIKAGPVVVYLNLNGVATNFAVNNIPQGNYDGICFRIHTPEDSEVPPYPEFKEGSRRYSVIVKGVYNSVPFVYKSKISAYKYLNLETPLRVINNSAADLTITMDHPLRWFFKDGILMNPSNTDNENEINNNIERSFKRCYRDDDRDGKG
ncbi:MAG: hypothetical protein OQK57_09455 [Ignavibacteriaceae bacterium]|nr:hypothetical protein [Ignavibacteriaceae bacterium]